MIFKRLIVITSLITSLHYHFYILGLPAPTKQIEKKDINNLKYD